MSDPGSDPQPKPQTTFKTGTPAMDKPPFIPECELFFEGGPNATQLYQQCHKKHGHKDFINVKDFKMDDLPSGFRTEAIMNAVEQYCNRTVRVAVNYTSHNRPNTYPNSTAPYPYSQYKGSRQVTRCGTGYVRYTLPSGVVKGQPCPCHICRKSKSPKKTYLYVTVTTASHIVFSSDEAASSEFELFYDSVDRKGVKVLYGVKVHDDEGDGGYGYGNDFESGRAKLLEKCMEDRTLVTCVTHEPELIDELRSMHGLFDFEKPPFPLTVSHPHGLSKQISTVGRIHSCIIPVPSDRPTNDIYFIGPRSKCIMMKNSVTSMAPSNEFFKIVENGDSSDKLREEYTLKEGITLSLPPGATHLCQYLLHDKTGNANNQQMGKFLKKFPSGTRFTYKNIQDSFLLPDVEFYEENGKTVTFPKRSSYFLTYSMPTCPGCSGAPVRADSDIFPLYWDSHSGAFHDDMNRSGIHSPNYVNR